MLAHSCCVPQTTPFFLKEKKTLVGEIDGSGEMEAVGDTDAPGERDAEAAGEEELDGVGRAVRDSPSPD